MRWTYLTTDSSMAILSLSSDRLTRSCPAIAVSTTGTLRLKCNVEFCISRTPLRRLLGAEVRVSAAGSCETARAAQGASTERLQIRREILAYMARYCEHSDEGCNNSDNTHLYMRCDAFGVAVGP